MNSVFFYLLAVAVLAIFIGPVVGVVGLVMKKTPVAVGGFVAVGAGLVLALVIGILATIVGPTSTPEPAVYSPSPSVAPGP